MSEFWTRTALSWGLTYLLHSTLLLTAAWLIARALGSGRDAAKEWIWKTALVGGLVTSGLQVGLALDPALGRWSVFTTEPAPETARVPSRGGSPERDGGGGTPRAILSGAGEVASPAGVASRTSAPRRALALTSDAYGRSALAIDRAWRDGLLLLWTMGGLLGAALLCHAWSRIADRLAGRRELKRGPAVDALRELCRRAGLPRRPRLCVSARITSPATVGVVFPLILLPERALTDLASAQREAMLAHELAHVARRDPLWSFVARLIERSCFLQPWNRVARKAIGEIAEYRSDEWAVRHTGRELELARCLTEVAGWKLEEREGVALLPMAGRGSRLSERVQRLLRPAPPRAPRPSSPLLLPAVALLLASTTFVLPGAAAEIDAVALRLERAFGEPAASEPASAESRAPRPTAERTPREFVIEELGGPRDAPPGEAPAIDALTNDLRALVAAVDVELDGLRTEFAALEAHGREHGLEAEQAATLARLQVRAEELRARQARVAALLPLILAGDGARSTMSDPETEE